VLAPTAGHVPEEDQGQADPLVVPGRAVVR
jgi:hypothetical protein